MMRFLATTVVSSLLLVAAMLPARAQPDCARSASSQHDGRRDTGCPVAHAALATATVSKSGTLNPVSVSSVSRAPSFVATYREATHHDAPTLILLHGSGGNETSLMALAEQAAPGAALLGIRGRVVQDGVNRWYKRLTPTTFDQDDVRAEASAFANFLARAQKDYGIDLQKAIFLGYSNGANLLAALSLLHPDLVQRAVLLRPMMVLQSVPDVDLAHRSILAVAGKSDTTYGPFAPGLEASLRNKGAEVLGQTVELGHLLGDADVGAVRNWLASLSQAGSNPAPIKTAAASSH